MCQNNPQPNICDVTPAKSLKHNTYIQYIRTPLLKTNQVKTKTNHVNFSFSIHLSLITKFCHGYTCPSSWEVQPGYGLVSGSGCMAKV